MSVEGGGRGYENFQLGTTTQKFLGEWGPLPTIFMTEHFCFELYQVSSERCIVDGKRRPFCENRRVKNRDAKSQKNDARDATDESDSETSV